MSIRFLYLMFARLASWLVLFARSPAATTSYDAWGNSLTSGGLTSATPFGYAGGYTDPDGLLYLVNRYYDPATGQFLSVDPLISLTSEPYEYADGDPVNQADPSGAVALHWFWNHLWIAFGIWETVTVYTSSTIARTQLVRIIRTWLQPLGVPTAVPALVTAVIAPYLANIQEAATTAVKWTFNEENLAKSRPDLWCTYWNIYWFPPGFFYAGVAFCGTMTRKQLEG